jgi:NAD(P)-dependent dehydrogenase (short-subunit alcohol dehydrogenase family)
MANTQKTAIVTGASQGIGAGLVESFLKRGYNVVGNSRNITKSNRFSASDNLALVDGDIGDPKTAAKIVDTAVSRFGRVDVLINNAGTILKSRRRNWLQLLRVSGGAKLSILSYET